MNSPGDNIADEQKTPAVEVQQAQGILVQKIIHLQRLNFNNFYVPVRAEQAHAIARDLQGGTSVAIHGTFTIGKTQIFHQLTKLLPEHSFALVVVGSKKDTLPALQRIEEQCNLSQGNIIVGVDEFIRAGDQMEVALDALELLRKKYPVTFVVIRHYSYDSETESHRDTAFSARGYLTHSLRPLNFEETSAYVRGYFSSLGLQFSERTLAAIHDMSGGRILDIRSVASATAMYAIYKNTTSVSKNIDVTHEEIATDERLWFWVLEIPELDGLSKALSMMMKKNSSPKIITFMQNLICKKYISLEEAALHADPTIIKQLLRTGFIRVNQAMRSYEINGEILRRALVREGF